MDTPTPPQPSPPSARQIANANLGVTNIVARQQIHTDMGTTYERIVEILSEHCGPYGRFAAIANPEIMGMDGEPIFTKDGINIIRAVEFVSVMEQMVKRLVMFVGQKIEAEAGDGTTSSMIMACSALASLANSLNDKVYSYTDLTTKYALFLKVFGELYSSKIMTVTRCVDAFQNEDPDLFRKVVKAIAFNQAYSSSHGDLELSECVAELYANTPPEGWDYTFYARSKFENGIRLEFITDKDQFTTEATVLNPAMCNDGFGLKYKTDSVDMLILRENFMADSPITRDAMLTIISHYERKLPLVVICPMGMDGVMSRTLADLPVRYGTNCVAFFQVETGNKQMHEIVSLCMLLDKPVDEAFSRERPVRLSNVQVSYDDGELKLNNVYANPNQTSSHPALSDPNHPMHAALTARLGELTTIMQRMAHNEHTKLAKGDVSALRRLHCRLMLTQRSYLKIGGGQYDNATLVDIVEDAMLSTRQALKTGFVLGGNKTMLAVLDELFDRYCPIASTDKDAEAIVLFASAFKTAIVKVHECTYKDYDAKAKFNLNYVEPDKLSTQSVNVLCSIPRVGYSIEAAACPGVALRGHDGAVIIQPADIDLAILRRFGEVALKYLVTDKFVLQGCAYIDKKPN